MKSNILKFSDGVVNIVNKLVNQRSTSTQNSITASRIPDSEVRALIRTGLGSKILRIKSSYALNDTVAFVDKSDRDNYEVHLQSYVKEAASNMLAWGRGCIVLVEHNADLSKPRTGPVDLEHTTLQVLPGDIIKPMGVDVDLKSKHYMKPKQYTARGVIFHPSRVIDFTYVKPAEDNLAMYHHGGVSEFELVRTQIINDGIVERASGAIVEKNSISYHKIAGFKDAVRAGNDDEVVQYYQTLESLKSIYGAGIIDAEDDVISVAQVLSNLSEVDQITLRRLAMVTGIPLSILIGENVKGMNSSGDNERTTFQDTIENLQSDYLLKPLNALLAACGMRPVLFKKNQGGTANERMDFETKVIENASKLYNMGEDYHEYLRKNEIIEEEGFDEYFKTEGKTVSHDDAADSVDVEHDDDSIDPKASLNGAQVTAILEIMGRVTRGEITRNTAEKVMATAFPVSAEEARSITGEVIEGSSDE